MITSLQNPRVKAVAKLRDRRARDAAGQFVIDDPRDLHRAIAAGVDVEVVFATDPAAHAIEAPVEPVAANVLAKMSYRGATDGIVAVCFTPPPRPLPTLHAGDVALVAVGTEKPGNLGALARTAAAAGCACLVAAGPTVDLWNPNTIRNSTGAIFSLPVIVAAEDDVRAWLAEQQATSIALVVGAEDSIWSMPLPTDAATALVVGPEHAGLSDQWRRACTCQASISQVAGAVDSLNAATAAAVALFEVVRRRVMA